MEGLPMLKSLLVASFLFSSSVSLAGQDFDPNLYIDSVEVYELDTHEAPVQNLVEIRSDKSLEEIALIIDGLLAIGKKVWPVIDANRPVITTSSLAPSISIIPEVEAGTAKAELAKMANWSVPKSVSYRVVYKNVYKMEVVSFTYTIMFQYNGSYKGKGKYITSLKTQASEVSAAWGFNFDAASELVNIANVGSEEAPVASGILQVSYKVRGLLNEMRNAQSFYVDGNGDIKLLN
jgi:hypothetical protein